MRETTFCHQFIILILNGHEVCFCPINWGEMVVAGACQGHSAGMFQEVHHCLGEGVGEALPSASQPAEEAQKKGVCLEAHPPGTERLERASLLNASL